MTKACSQLMPRIRETYTTTLLGIAQNPTFASWKVAGNAGGEANIDPVRGVYADGGLHAERLRWHLPRFDDSRVVYF